MPSFYFSTALTSEAKQTYRNVVFRDNILTLALYTVHSSCEFKHIFYQMYKADYCLKHFKLVFIFIFCNPFAIPIYYVLYLYSLSYYLSMHELQASNCSVFNTRLWINFLNLFCSLAQFVL